MRKEISGRVLELVQGNIVHQEVDALVNAANTKLAGGGGVDGAIHRAAGPALKEACLLLPADHKGRRCPTGEARITEAGNLKARWVIHAVGPYFNERYQARCEQQLESAYTNALRLAVERQCQSIALPAISAGAYRFPLHRAAEIALQTSWAFLEEESSIQLIRFVLYNEVTDNTFQEVLAELGE